MYSLADGFKNATPSTYTGEDLLRQSNYYGSIICGLQGQIERMKKETEVMHGRWNESYMVSKYTVSQTCSCCKNVVIRNIANVFRFCPSCGAKMDL